MLFKSIPREEPHHSLSIEPVWERWVLWNFVAKERALMSASEFAARGAPFGSCWRLSSTDPKGSELIRSLWAIRFAHELGPQRGPSSCAWALAHSDWALALMLVTVHADRCCMAVVSPCREILGSFRQWTKLPLLVIGSPILQRKRSFSGHPYWPGSRPNLGWSFAKLMIMSSANDHRSSVSAIATGTPVAISNRYDAISIVNGKQDKPSWPLWSGLHDVLLTL